MPFYNYGCEKCGNVQEERHGMNESPIIKCSNCKGKMDKLITADFSFKFGHFKSRAEKKDSEHMKKVKDPERAVRMRKKAFGREAVGDPSMKTDPRHIIKRGKTLGGQQKEVDRSEFIKAAAKDPMMVAKAQEALKKKGQK